MDEILRCARDDTLVYFFGEHQCVSSLRKKNDAKKPRADSPCGLAGTAEGNWRDAFAAGGARLQASAGLVGPGALRGVLEIENPLFAGGEALSAFFVSQRQIKMHIRMGGHGARGAAKMFDGFIELAQFLESAAEVVARNSVERINLHGVEEGVAGVGELAKLVIGDAEIDVRFDPVWREVHHALVILNCLRESLVLRFAIERGAEKIFGRGPSHGVKFCWLRGPIKRERPLLQKRIERQFRAGRNDVNFAAQINEAELMHRQGSGAELFFNESDGAAYFSGRHMILGETLNGTQREQIHETIKALAPARFGTDEPQTFPVAETVRLKTKNAAGFGPRVSLRQCLKTPAPRKIGEVIMHRELISDYGTRLWKSKNIFWWLNADLNEGRAREDVSLASKDLTQRPQRTPRTRMRARRRRGTSAGVGSCGNHKRTSRCAVRAEWRDAC